MITYCCICHQDSNRLVCICNAPWLWQLVVFDMMTSSNENIFHVTDQSFVQGIHWSPVNSPQKGQWHGALMFSLICAWINAWVNNREAADLRCHLTHYEVIVMSSNPTTIALHLKWIQDIPVVFESIASVCTIFNYIQFTYSMRYTWNGLFETDSYNSNNILTIFLIFEIPKWMWIKFWNNLHSGWFLSIRYNCDGVFRKNFTYLRHFKVKGWYKIQQTTPLLYR